MIPHDDERETRKTRQQGNEQSLSGLDEMVFTIAATLRTFTLPEIASEVRCPTDEALTAWPASDEQTLQSLHRLYRAEKLDWTFDRRDGFYRTWRPQLDHDTADVQPLGITPSEAKELCEFIDGLSSGGQMSPYRVGPHSAIATVLVHAGIMPGEAKPIPHRRVLLAIAKAIGAKTADRERGEFLFHRARVFTRRRLIELTKEANQ